MDKHSQDLNNIKTQNNEYLVRDIHYEFINEELLEDMSHEEKLAQLTTFDKNKEQEILNESHCVLEKNYYKLNEITKDLTNKKLRASDLKDMSASDRKHAHIETNEYTLTRKSSKSTVNEIFDSMHNDDNHHKILFTAIVLLIIALTIATKTPYLLVLLVVLLAYKIFLVSKTKKRQNNVK